MKDLDFDQIETVVMVVIAVVVMAILYWKHSL
jgi:uncharacterized membrane protein